MTIRKKTRKGKKWVNSNKPTYKNITFESALELYMYKLLEKAKIKFDYIGDQNAKYELLKSFKYPAECYERAQKRSKAMRDTRAVSSIGYTPDFVGEDNTWFIEVKGRKLGDFSMRWKLFKEAISAWDPQPVLFMPTKKEDCEQVIQILKELKL